MGIDNLTIDSFFTILAAKLGRVYTEEQSTFAKDFTSPAICFADPGTGKTETAIAGLITAESFYRIPGNKIYALSFTKLATSELEVRHRIACKKLGMTQTVNFKTLHSLCTALLNENYTKLGLTSIKIGGSTPIEEVGKMLIDSAEELDIKLNPRNIRSVIYCIRQLNNSLIFDKDHVTSKISFKKTGLSYEDFTKLRSLLYQYNKITKVIPVDDILLYTLELLLTAPEVSATFKENCKLMLVDEAQDLSLLQLRLISLLTNNAVLIGDVKQRIYAFNGACQEIVAQYMKYYPQARTLRLSQSFRCKNEIADYATSLILFNKEGGEDFKGTGDGGSVTIDCSFNVGDIAESISNDFIANDHTFPKSIMFLFRNNISMIPIAEELFKRKVPFQSNKYTGAHEIEVIKELCALVNLAINNTTLSNVDALKYLIPEFRKYKNYTSNPIYRIASELGCGIFDVEYDFRDEYVGAKAMEVLMQVAEENKKGTTVGKLFNLLWPLFNANYLCDREPFLEYPSSYYTNLVAPLVNAKTYNQFVKDELLKVQFIEENNTRRLGVKCYTCHASKGLEADIVHFIDANKGILPSDKVLDEMIKYKCQIDAAREVRNERSLVYVSATRAKSEFHVHYDAGSGLSSLFAGVNLYKDLDAIYDNHELSYCDVEEFIKFYGGE